MLKVDFSLIVTKTKANKGKTKFQQDAEILQTLKRYCVLQLGTVVERCSGFELVSLGKEAQPGPFLKPTSYLRGLKETGQCVSLAPERTGQ